MSDCLNSGPYAHSDPEYPEDPEKWEPLFSEDCPALLGFGNECPACAGMERFHGHLNKVAYWAAKFASEMFAAGSEDAKAAWEWGYLAGLWHDLGKFAPRWQEYLKVAAKGGASRGPDHSTAGAKQSALSFGPLGHLLSFTIAGHHAGLANMIVADSGRSLAERLADETVEDWTLAPDVIIRRTIPSKPPVKMDGLSLAFFDRLLFSALVDADFLATETFMNPAQSRLRPEWPENVLKRMESALETWFREKFGPAKTDIDREREKIRRDCLQRAKKSPGLFTLTVPTGGGKTLASLAFGIRHAIEHGLRRIIYVIPYTSIIEQNAGEFRKVFADLSGILGREIVVEHHSSFDPDSSENLPVYKLACENWDAPLIVTTSVQFFESLYATKTSRCRKLHNVTRSVVIFDEAQNLPVEYLRPCLRSIEHLTEIAGTSFVFCTATQPAVGKRRDEFEIGLDLGNSGERELVSDPKSLSKTFERVTIEIAGEISDDDLISEIQRHERILCIVNTKPHAAEIFDGLEKLESGANFHLSAQLCPEHRQAVLKEIRRREECGAPCRLISTTVVEAGVDLDFPIVFRAMTGLDSLTQAAGRCNRHAKLSPAKGRVVLFTATDQKIPGFLTQNVNATRQLLPDYGDDLGSLDAIDQFFRLLYWMKGPEVWDKHKILECFQLQESAPPFLFNFSTAARNFRIIPDNQKPVIVEPKPGLWEGQEEEKSAEIRCLLDEIRDRHRVNAPPPPDSHRRLQRYTVQVPISRWDEMVRTGAVQLFCNDQFPILIHPENDYDRSTGLEGNGDPSAFVI